MTNSERRERPDLPGGFWGALSAAERATLSGFAAHRIFEKDSTLVSEGDTTGHVVVILSGFAKVFTTSIDGDESMLGVRGPGDTIGEIGAFARRPRIATVTALEEIRGLVMDGERFRNVLETSAHASAALSQVLLNRQVESDWRLTMGAYDGEQRLARLLLELLNRFGERGPDGAVGMGLPLSQTELASWIGKSREMVARAYRTWRDADIVRTGRRSITVMNVAELARIAGGEHRRGREEGV